MTMFLPLVMDSCVAILLLVTIVYVVRLNSRLAVLRQDRDHLGETVKALQTASRQAEEAVLGLKLTASEAGQELQSAIEKGGLIKADLTFLIDKAGSTADRVEHALKAQRDTSPRAMEVRATRAPAPQVQPIAEPSPPGKDETKFGAGRLARLLRQVDNQENPGRTEPVLTKLPEAKPADLPEPVVLPIKSRAERDLQRALEARR